MNNKIFSLLFLAMILSSQSVFAWGRVGHDAIAYIAECNLTSKAKKNIEKILDGHSIVYYASWMDEIRHTPEYKHTTRWHTNAVDAEGNYVPNPNGDAMIFLEDCITKLKDYQHQDDSTVVVSLRFLIHLVGDMHCPGHVKYPWYKNFKFMMNNKGYEWHSYWDDGALSMNHKWYYTEYQHQLDRCLKKEKKEIGKGTPRDWLAESASECKVIYEWVKPDQKLSANESRDFNNVAHVFAEQQLLKAGYRLATLLNELFG